jgi:DNA processing protein
LLIQKGEAKLVLDAWDILEEYRYSYPHKIHPRVPILHKDVPTAEADEPQQKREEPFEMQVDAIVIDLKADPEAVTDDERVILLALEGREATADEIIEETGIPARRVLSALTMLQLRTLVHEEHGKRFRTPVILKGYEDRGEEDAHSGSLKQ